MSDQPWVSASRGFGEAVRTYHRRHGRAVDDPSVDATVRTNTVLVPQRARIVMLLLRELAGREHLREQRVLEAGCGFGALAGYLAWHEGPRQVVGIDNRTDFIEAATECSRGLGLGARLQFRVADMRDLDGIEDGAFDVVVVNNAYVYLPTACDGEEALGAFRRVLAPGGSLVFHQANKWVWHEPFSQDPLVHLLPPAIARRISGVTGWKHNHGRVRLVSPRQLRRALRRHGFVDVRTGAPHHGRILTGTKMRGARYFGAVARRP